MIVTYVKQVDNRALVTCDGLENYVSMQPGETAEQAATRWAMAAFGVKLTILVPLPTLASILAKQLPALLTDPGTVLGQPSKDALSVIIAAAKAAG